MKAFFKPVMLPVVALLLAAAPLSRLEAQQSEFKPAVIVSVASIDKMMGDFSYLAEAAGSGETAAIAKGMVGLMAAGVDQKRPGGAYITFKEQQPVPVVFIPVTNLKALLKIHEKNIGVPEDAGDGLLRIDAPNGTPVYVKEADGWAFASPEKNLLASVPADPLKLLGGLDKQYMLSARVMARNVPKELREMAISELKKGFEGQLSELGDGEGDRELMQAMSRNQLKSIEQLINETDELTVGWAVDSMAKRTYIDISMTAVAGSDLAKRLAVKESASAYSGFLLPDAAAAVHVVNAVTKEDALQLKATLDAMSKKALESIDDDEELDSPAKKAAAKDIVASLFKVMNKTAESGRLDGGASLLLGDTMTVVAGVRAVDTAEIDRILHKAADLAKSEPDFPGVKFNADTHGNVKFHTMSVPVKEDDAKKLFGDNLDIAIGLGDNSVYLSLGEGGIAALKKVIDKSAADAGKPMPPGQFYLALAPILKYAAAVSDDPVTSIIAASADKLGGNDRISVVSTPIERGSRTRIQIDEGVVKLLGEIGKNFGGGVPGGAF